MLGCSRVSQQHGEPDFHFRNHSPDWTSARTENQREHSTDQTVDGVNLRPRLRQLSPRIQHWSAAARQGPRAWVHLVMVLLKSVLLLS